jgi:hypothetical protein
MLEDHETTDLDGAAFWEAHRDTGWEPTDGEYSWREDDVELNRELDAERDPSEGFYPEWNGEVIYVPVLSLPEFDPEDIPF